MEDHFWGPAKKGTEVKWKHKRDENLAIAKTLTQQGNHNQAWEHYVKCIDVMPQMAFQLIKALRAEQIPYMSLHHTKQMPSLLPQAHWLG